MDAFSYQSVRLGAVPVVLLTIIGVIANTAAIGAILRTRLRRYPQSQYLLALLPVRQLMLLILLNSYLPNLWQHSYMACIFTETVGSFCSFAQGWLMVVMCAEPIIQYRLPQSTRLARRRSQLFISCVVTIAIAFALFSGMKTTPIGSESQLKRMCYWKEWRLMSAGHAIVCLALPLAAALGFSAWRPAESSLNDRQDARQSSDERRKRRTTQPERIRFVTVFSHFFLILPFYALFGFAAVVVVHSIQASVLFHALAFYFLYIDLASSLPLWYLGWPQFRKSLYACWWSEDNEPSRSHPPTVHPRKPRSTKKRSGRRRKIHRHEQSSEHAGRTSQLVTEIASLTL